MRQMSVAGSFYPAEQKSIEDMIAHFNRVLNQHTEANEYIDSLCGVSIIVPHAGWVYSGFTANIAHRVLSHTDWNTIIVIGPSHRVGFEGISVADTDTYQTPLGTLKIDQEFTHDIRSRFNLPYYPQAHREHSTEVQMPFIKYYMPNTKVVEIVYSNTHPDQIQQIIQYALSKKGLAVVISTDLSHYYSLDQAQHLDSLCLEAIETEDSDRLHDGCEACGMIGVEAMINTAKDMHYESTLLDYRTSADASGDTSRVVGYASALFRPAV